MESNKKIMLAITSLGAVATGSMGIYGLKSTQKPKHTLKK